MRHAGGRPHRAHGNIFIRPAEDNKAFDGMLMDTEMLADWRRDPARARLHKMQVIVSPVKAIYCEYRLFIVKRKVVSASVYRIGGRAELSPTVEDDVLDYARAIIERWTPADSFVMDVGLTQDGLKVIEFNNINSSGFYAINVPKYVDAIQTQYG
ncbi:ATP-grasp domain-containing protein [Massilia genomosp. 1]|uniref:ATP-grasp domain-containing protein n=1 Tax=Massilia genomosp. 1 TaxID=2609280 RepID=UPI00141DEF55